ncbi:diguanylate cyclase response regulator [Solimonas fluminis]|uniref:diguanylate cyclase n=1 Tax=Solimonas fluminis TaxID=2086571 RepID=A0A2S5THP9_9GAMM|nr:diguanylate cyclase [Solimonas fluminis]PPE74516.1 diguanylate cyclase response regulator [Solimonas fluminis]
MRDLTPDASHRFRLLIVDDQPINIRVLHEALSVDYEIFMTTNGLQALEICARERPDLVLLDIEMPDIDGIEVCRRIKSGEVTKNIPVLFVTGHTSPEQEALGLEVGAVDFIAKPIHPAVVRARVRTHLLLKWQADLLRRMALIDGLTGVANRRCFDDALDLEWRVCSRSGESLGLAMIDVDYFKRFNDQYGHQAGDTCLKTVAQKLRGLLRRPRDLIARYGGEEFVCMIPGASLDALRDISEGLRSAVESAMIPHGGSDCSDVVTVSIGIAVAYPRFGESPDVLMQSADRSLYAAKQSGRNRVLAEPSNGTNAQKPRL